MNPKTFTLGEASGKSKTTISKALKSGKLSYRAKTTAGYEIDPAELARVYPGTFTGTPKSDDRAHPEEQVETPGERGTEALRAEVAALREMVAMLKEDKADWKAQAERLAIAREEAAKRPEATQEVPPPRRWFGWGRGRAA